MRASYRWLMELSKQSLTPNEVAEKLTEAGLEVEELIEFPAPEGVVVAEVLSIRPHPKRDKLNLVTVDHGQGQQEVVCGASNVPGPGGRVLLAKLGAELPPAEAGGEPFVIAERPIGGIPSAGMLCSESELQIGEGGNGIFVFPADDAPAPGTPLTEALPVGDTVFEIGLTPNRPDCLGHVGIARDLVAMCGGVFEVPKPGAPSHFAEGSTVVAGNHELDWEGAESKAEVTLDDQDVPTLSVQIEDSERCPRYGAALVHGVTVNPSPFWLRYRLHCLGLRSRNALVDATNFIMLKWGHPIHGFDADKLAGRAIKVGLATDGQNFRTLDGEDRTLAKDDLLIGDKSGPIAIAGVMGGENSEIDESTKHIAIEVAYFQPQSVRRTSRRLGMHTDASHRFERGVDPNAIPVVLADAASLIANLGGGVAIRNAIDEVAKPINPVTITLPRWKLDGLLGVSAPNEAVVAALESIGCEVTGESSEQQAWTVIAPTFRPDLTLPEDLIEEVGRIWGHEHIVPVLPRISPSKRGTPRKLRFERALKERAASAGFLEAICYAFVSENSLSLARCAPSSVFLQNPMSEERAVMRSTLLVGLVQSARSALARQAGRVALFELGRVFAAQANEVLPEETTIFAGLLTGEAPNIRGAEKAEASDFFDLKGMLEHTLDGLGASHAPLRVEFNPNAAPYFHPRRTATVFGGEIHLGNIGELHPDVADAFGLRTRAYYFELDFQALETWAHALPVAPVIPRYPAVDRDVALLLSREVPSAEVAHVLKKSSELVESVKLFDVFEGGDVPPGQRSLAFRVRYRSNEETLTDKKVDKAHKKLVASVKSSLGASAR